MTFPILGWIGLVLLYGGLGWIAWSQASEADRKEMKMIGRLASQRRSTPEGRQ